MGVSKNIYTNSFPELILQDKDLKRLQSTLNDMLIDIDKIARENGLHCILSGGTLLGAIRHKGFIPWDDDIDIMMFREECEKLKVVLKEQYADKYIVRTPKDDKTINKMMKIYLKGTKYVEISTESTPINQGIFIDVFPIENLPKKYKLRGWLHFVCIRASSVTADLWYPSKTILNKAKTNKELRKHYKKRRLLGIPVSFLSPFAWTRLAEKMANYPKETGMVTIPAGFTYFREIFEKKVFDELIEVEFEGKNYYSPKDYDKYLTNLYKNYMQIPPEDKRERHIAVEISFSEAE